MPLSREQFEEAVRLQGPRVRRALLSLVDGRAQDAEDLLQRTFERAWAKRDTLRTEAVGAWLLGIARQELLTWLRSRSRYGRLKEAITREPTVTPDVDPADAAPDPDRLRVCLQRLEALDRLIIDRFYGRRSEAVDDAEAPLPRTDREIAVDLEQGSGPSSWNPARVRMRRHRAIHQLRVCLERVEPRAPAGSSPSSSEALRHGPDPDLAF